jgi:uncharacterized membrane protein YoaK (UPF0700 family)
MSRPNVAAERPLTALLLALTFGTGLIDAVSFLGLDRVFVANMTGNVVLLGFALAGADDLQVLGPVLALAGFLGGALAGGWLAERLITRPRRWLLVALGAQTSLIAVAVAIAAADPAATRPVSQQTLIGLLAVGMGMQAATARAIAVPDLSTTVVTTTLAGLAADWNRGDAKPQLVRRVLVVAALILGALVGAMVILNVSLVAALLLAVVVLAAASTGLVAIAVTRMEAG